MRSCSTLFLVLLISITSPKELPIREQPVRHIMNMIISLSIFLVDKRNAFFWTVGAFYATQPMCECDHVSTGPSALESHSSPRSILAFIHRDKQMIIMVFYVHSTLPWVVNYFTCIYTIHDCTPPVYRTRSLEPLQGCFINYLQ